MLNDFIAVLASYLAGVSAINLTDNTVKSECFVYTFPFFGNWLALNTPQKTVMSGELSGQNGAMTLLIFFACSAKGVFLPLVATFISTKIRYKNKSAVGRRRSKKPIARGCFDS